MKLTIQILMLFGFVGCTLVNSNSTQKCSPKLECNYFLFDSITSHSSIESYLKKSNTNFDCFELEVQVLMDHSPNFERTFKIHFNNYELVISECPALSCSNQFIINSEIYKIYYSEDSILDKNLRESIDFQESEFSLAHNNRYLVIVSHPLSRTGSQMQNYYIHVLDFKMNSVYGFQSHMELTNHLLKKENNVEVLKSFKYDYWSKQFIEYGIPVLEIDDAFENEIRSSE